LQRVSTRKKTVVSEDILERNLFCNLSACKEHVASMEMLEHLWWKTKFWNRFIKNKTLLRKEGIAATKAQELGQDSDGKLGTPLIENRLVLTLSLTWPALCGISDHNQVIDWKNLFPVILYLFA
jgi:hypothetical protein